MSQNTIHIQIITPEKVVFEGEVNEATVNTKSGEITILPHHTPLVSILELGAIKVKVGGAEHYFAVDGGVLEVRKSNKIIVLTSQGERAEDIDIEKTREAFERAKKLMEERQNETEVDWGEFKQEMLREFNRLNVASRRDNRK